MRLKSFQVELRDLNQNDEWTYADVFYEREGHEHTICEIIDEFNNRFQLKDLSHHDRERVERDFIYNLSADEAGNVRPW